MTQTAHVTPEMLHYYKRRVDILEQENSEIKQRYYELKQAYDWGKQLEQVSPDTISVSHKATVKASIRYMRKAKRGPGGWVKMNPWKTGRAAGQSDQTVRNNWSYCSIETKQLKGGREVVTNEGPLPLFDKKLVKVSTPDTTRYPKGYFYETYLRERDLVYHPQSYQYNIQEPRKQGGVQEKRCKCGGELKTSQRVLTQQEITICTACGMHHIGSIETVNDPLTPTEEADAFIESQIDILRNGEPSPETSNDAIEDDTQNINLTRYPTPPLESQVDFLQQSEDIPSTPPDVCVSDHDIETETAALLLAIAGEHTEHIKMIPDDSKYTTMKKPLQLGDMRSHIRGYKTLGTRLYYADGSTRALMYDADSPEQWERCKEAARLLDRVFMPVLEPSPAPADCPGYHSGGGRLWMFFDARVDAYSAKKTVEKYTGDLLQDIKEVWPPETDSGNRARLPGGMYIMKDFKERCKLYTVDGEEVTRLSQHLTPACAVDPYDKPEPEPEPIQTTQEAQARGVLGKDVKKSIIQVLNDDLRWDDLAARAGGRDKRGYFLAAWRGDNKKPNVFVDPDTDLAKDFSSNAWPGGPFDKYDCLTRLEYFDECQRSGTACSYEGWKAYKRAALDTLKADKQHLHIIPSKVAPAPEPQHDHEHKQATSPYSELAHDLGIPEGQPCEKCGCTLSYQSAGYTMCYRCLPRSEKRGGLTEEQAQRLAAIPRVFHAIQRRAS